MEIFIIVVAVIAVAAALILLVLLQIRIKKHARAEQSTINQPTVSVSQAGEIAPDFDPNDPFLRTGPPPYIQVMKFPELYPLSSATNIGYGGVKIQIPTPIQNERTKRTWNQFLNVVLRSDDQEPNIPMGKYTTEYNIPVAVSIDSHKANNTPNLSIIDEVLPTYDEVRSRITNEESAEESRERKVSSCDSAVVVKPGHYNFLGFNFGIEKTMLCKKDCAFTITNGLQSVITEELTRSPARPRLATM